MTSTEKILAEQIEEWKKEIGEIPENTCPIIDGIIEDIEKYVDEVEYLRKNAHKYESAEDLGKDLPDSGWSGLTSDIDKKLREDNEKLRELGKFWYEKCKELITSIAQAVAEERERVRGIIEGKQEEDYKILLITFSEYGSCRCDFRNGDIIVHDKDGIHTECGGKIDTGWVPIKNTFQQFKDDLLASLDTPSDK